MRENFINFGKTPSYILDDINMDKVDAFLQSTKKVRKKITNPEIFIRYDFRGIELSVGDDISFYTRSEARLESGIITKINNFSATILSDGHTKHRFYKQISKFNQIIIGVNK